MRKQSIQLSIVLMAGTCVIAVIAALVIYALSANAKTQTLVREHTQALMQETIGQQLVALAKAQVGELQDHFESPMAVAKDLAILNANLHNLPHLTRNELTQIAGEYLKNHPNLLDLFIAWEPNAFGEDADHLQQGDSHDANGRYMPWWYRDAAGLTLAPVGGELLESTTLQPSGVREGEFYLCVKESRALCVVDPASYDYGGQQILVSSFNAPILVNGQFKGSVGTDLALDFIQKRLVEAKQGLYAGAGEISLIANNGSLIASTKDANMIAKSSSLVLSPSVQTALTSVKGTEGYLHKDLETQTYALLQPFYVAGSSRLWTLVIELPISAVYANIQKLDQTLSDQAAKDAFAMTLIGVLMTIIGLALIAFIGYGIARPMRQMVRMLEDIAQGDGDLTARLQVSRQDELGQIANGFNHFLDKLQLMIRDVVGSVAKVSDSSVQSSAIADRTNHSVQKQMTAIEQVATAVQQMSATAHDVANNASQAAQAANHADQAANQGKAIVANTVQSISDLAGEISHAEAVVQKLAQESENIHSILVVIRGVSEQTNLLALNAAIEAARAGELGRGFAVVADEVRSLAQKTQAATTEIQALLEQLQNGTLEVVKVMTHSQERTHESVQQAQSAATALENITEAVSVINAMNIQIASAAEEQSAVAEDINRNVSHIDQVARDVALGADESSQASQTLTQLAQQQRQLIEQFKV